MPKVYLKLIIRVTNYRSTIIVNLFRDIDLYHIFVIQVPNYRYTIIVNLFSDIDLYHIRYQINKKLNFPKKYCAEILIIGVCLLFIPSSLQNLKISFASSTSENYQGIASQIINQKNFNVGDATNNVLVLIPNEAHESPNLPKEQRLIDQSYIPENIVVDQGTNIMWFNGDVGHTHKITLVDESSNNIFDSGTFAFNTVSKPVVLDLPGKYTYSESNVIDEDPDFKMQGTITVVGNNNTDLNSKLNTTTDTVGLFMVPAKDSKVHVANLEKNDLQVLDQHTFEDLREGQKGTGTQQALLLVGTNDKQLDDFISALKSISAELPYS